MDSAWIEIAQLYDEMAKNDMKYMRDCKNGEQVFNRDYIDEELIIKVIAHDTGYTQKVVRECIGEKTLTHHKREVDEYIIEHEP